MSACSASDGSGTAVQPVRTSTSPATSGTSTTPAPQAPIANGAAVDPGVFRTAMKRPSTVILDVRTPEEFSSGHLPGAINVDFEAPDFSSKIATLDKSLPYAVYCRSGNRSGQAVALMTADGFTSTYHLAGGIGAWVAAGGEVVH